VSIYTNVNCDQCEKLLVYCDCKVYGPNESFNNAEEEVDHLTDLVKEIEQNYFVERDKRIKLEKQLELRISWLKHHRRCVELYAEREHFFKDIKEHLKKFNDNEAALKLALKEIETYKVLEAAHEKMKKKEL
jgi:nicotinamide riboside kinase